MRISDWSSDVCSSDLVDPGKTYPSYNPATGELIEDAPEASVEHAEAAIAAARRAFDETTWSTDVDTRVRCLRQLQEALERHRDEFAQLTIAECGHTHMLVSGPALDSPVAPLGYSAQLAETFTLSQDTGDPAVIPEHPRVSQECVSAGK